MDFKEFSKISRYSRDCIITEKIDGTNGLIAIGDDGSFQVGSRTRWVTPENDNYGFAKWAYSNKDDLMKLGPGYHYGEWWGLGIQRGYGIKEKRFSLFNISRWRDPLLRPICCGIAPTVSICAFGTIEVFQAIEGLRINGSFAAPGFMNPEGIVIFHIPSGHLYKKTIEKDDKHKGEL